MPARAALAWTGEGLQFNGGAVGGVQVRIDGEGKAGPSPVTLLLSSLATCMGSDVVSIVQKMRVAMQSLEIGVEADRAEENPRRLLRVRLKFHVRGGQPGDDAKIRHAIDLSREKYCSVSHSLRTDIEVSYALEFEPL
jgi:putative redox protein